MSDGAGPFGYDIHFALEVDYLIEKYQCDCFVETGTNSGDTTDYISRLYPFIDVITCETDDLLFNFSNERLSARKNVTILNESSEKVIEKYNRQRKYNMPFYYLDAHGEDYWPLGDELKNIEYGIICVSDFYIGTEEEYGYDFYNNVICDKDIILKNTNPSSKIYVNNFIDTIKNYPFQSLQNLRKSGRAYFTKNVNEDYFKDCSYFMEIPY
jgi:hypothetical protein